MYFIKYAHMRSAWMGNMLKDDIESIHHLIECQWYLHASIIILFVFLIVLSYVPSLQVKSTPEREIHHDNNNSSFLRR